MLTVSYWGLFSAIVAIASVISGAIIGWLKINKSWAQYATSWACTIGLAFGAWALKFLPALGEPEWAFVLMQGFVMGLVSNKFYDIPAIKKLYLKVFGEDFSDLVVIEEPLNKSKELINEVLKYVDYDGDTVKITVETKASKEEAK